MSNLLPVSTGDDLVQFVQNFTGSTDDNEIQQCVYLTEMMMRNIELPALRTNPWSSIGTANQYGQVPIPADMNRPILFFNQGSGSTGYPNANGAGPWIVYDRIGDRDIITETLNQNLYLAPYNIPQVYRGKFSEVGQYYEFLPTLGSGQQINMYYFTTWPLLFTPVSDTLISTTGTVGSIAGSGPWTATITGMTTTSGLAAGNQIYATGGTGSIGANSGTVTVVSIVNATSMTISQTGGTTPTAGSISNIYLTGQTVQSNAVLSSWPEGYVYGTLHNYYYKRKMSEDADKWLAKYNLAYDTVEDQNNKGKWSGGHTKLTSVFQPRKDQRFGTR